MRFYPPEIEHISHSVGEEEGHKKPFSPAEIKVVLILGIVLVLWFLSNWFSQRLDITMITLLGSVAIFLTGIRLISWGEGSRAISWDILLMISGVTSIGLASRDTGLAMWAVSTIFVGLDGLSVFWLIMGIGTFTVIIYLPVPMDPIVNAVFIPPIVALAVSMGKPALLFALPVIFTASCAFLLPLDALSLITYSKGYYKMFDMLWPGVVISLFWVIVLTALMMYVAPLVGLLP